MHLCDSLCGDSSVRSRTRTARHGRPAMPVDAVSEQACRAPVRGHCQGSAPIGRVLNRRLAYVQTWVCGFSGCEREVANQVVRIRQYVVRLGGRVTVDCVVHPCTNARLVRVANVRACNREARTTMAARVGRRDSESARVLSGHIEKREASITIVEKRMSPPDSGSWYVLRTSYYCLSSPRFSPNPRHFRSAGRLACDRGRPSSIPRDVGQRRTV